MPTALKNTILALTALLLLAGCVSSLTGSSMQAKPFTDTTRGMPPDDEAIATAVAVQVATSPKARYVNVLFAKEAKGISLNWLARQGFEFTEARLYVSRKPSADGPGQSLGEIELTDPLGRKALFMYDATYSKADGMITVSGLEVVRKYTAEPRMDFTVVRASDLPAAPLKDYGSLLRFLADKAIPPAEYRSLGSGEYAFFALARDWGGPEAKLELSVSGSPTGLAGYDKGSRFVMVDGSWPMALTIGTLDPATAKKPLYAKVSYRPRGGFTASRLLGVYQLAGFGQ